MKLPGRSHASRTVLLMLGAIALFELGAGGRLGQLWSLAFHGTATPGGIAEQQSGVPNPGSQAQQSQGASRPGVLH